MDAALLKLSGRECLTGVMEGMGSAVGDGPAVPEKDADTGVAVIHLLARSD